MHENQNKQHNLIDKKENSNFLFNIKIRLKEAQDGASKAEEAWKEIMKGKRGRKSVRDAVGASRRLDKPRVGPMGLYHVRRSVEAEGGLGKPKDVREVQKRPEKFGDDRRRPKGSQ